MVQSHLSLQMLFFRSWCLMYIIASIMRSLNAENAQINNRYSFLKSNTAKLQSKGINWSEVPLPCFKYFSLQMSHFSVFMRESMAATSQNGRMWCQFVRVSPWLALRTGPQTLLAGPEAWLAGLQQIATDDELTNYTIRNIWQKDYSFLQNSTISFHSETTFLHCNRCPKKVFF